MDLKYIVEALRCCRRLHALQRGKSFHSHLIKTGFSPGDVYMMNNLITLYSDFTQLNDARKLFDEMPVRNIVTWTSVVYACTRSGKPHDAIELFNKMSDAQSVMPTGFMYSAVLKACGLAGDVQLGRQIHERIRQENLEEDVVLMNTLLHMYVKCGRLSDARRVFDGMVSVANTTSWNTLISGYCGQGLMKEAVDLFQQMPDPNVASWNTVIAGLADNGSISTLEFVGKMHKEGLKLDEFTFPCALKTCGGYVGFFAMGKQIHCYALKSGFEVCCYTLSALVDMYSNSNALDEAVRLFESYCTRNGSNCLSLSFWNAMISGYVENDKHIQALNLLSSIHHSGVLFDSYTWSCALRVCINLFHFRLGVQVHGLLVTSGYELDCVVGSILTDLYAKLGKMKDSFAVFDKLPEKDSIAWSGLIIGCTKAGVSSETFSLFRDMVSLGLEVDQYVVSAMLKVCSSVSSLGKGKQIHAFCIKAGHETEAVAATALVDMYSKCGEIEESIALFNGLSDRDVVCWTGIIVGCGQNGKANEALEIFQEMIKSGIEPNEVTFLGLLGACRHAGLVEDGWRLFQSMRSDHGLEPQVEHYYCMVELLGQAGLLKEARKLISEMPLRPNKTIWSSLLAACVTHKNSEMISGIAENLRVAFPDDPSVYVMVSNAYATMEMWDDLNRVRETAKASGVKEAGRSWIEMAG
ncbi:unnamed protein product [Linum tenue]|uniref:Pentatricopeptide repeat-containing protein n=2 Tax=Linum tenue TaxID=586396 RepID=A0AAV0QML5_9ROSI|nr:unnamed protein product [Linum tenue]